MTVHFKSSGSLLLLAILFFGIAFVRRSKRYSRRNSLVSEPPKMREVEPFVGVAGENPPFSPASPISPKDIKEMNEATGAAAMIPYGDTMLPRAKSRESVAGMPLPVGRGHGQHETRTVEFPAADRAGSPFRTRNLPPGASTIPIREHEPSTSATRLGGSYEPLPVSIPAGGNTVAAAGSASFHSATEGTGPISAVDAAAMADAFRNAMRKPDFGDR